MHWQKPFIQCWRRYLKMSNLNVSAVMGAEGIRTSTQLSNGLGLATGGHCNALVLSPGLLCPHAGLCSSTQCNLLILHTATCLLWTFLMQSSRNAIGT